VRVRSVGRGNRGQKDEIRHNRYRTGRIFRLHGRFPSSWNGREAAIEDEGALAKTFRYIQARSQVIRASLIIAAVLGFLLIIYLVVDSGTAAVAQAMLVVGWWLLPITLFHLVPLTFSALSWRELLPGANRPDAFIVLRIRWIRESINSLLPVAGVGGDVASVRLAHLKGVPGAQAAASMVVDTTLGVGTQLIFVLSGVLLLLMRSTERSSLMVAAVVLIGMAILFVAITAFVLFQHRGLFAALAKFTSGLLSAKWLSTFAPGASTIDDAVVATYRSGWIMWRASLFRLVGWAAGAGEIWLVMQSLGHPVGMIDAYILESLGSGVRAAAFIVPGALGALEASYVLFGALFGLPADIALVISLSKRVRELALGVPGLLVWHWLEGQYLLRRGESKAR
jgi:putative membrane protein